MAQENTDYPDSGANAAGLHQGALPVEAGDTQPQSAHEELKASEARFRDLYENLPLMYFALGADGQIRLVNDQGARQLGYEADELIGTSVLDVFDPRDRPRVEKRFRESIAKPGDVARWQFRKRRKDGSVLWVDEIVRAVSDPDGRTEVRVICEDITARKESERILLQQKRSLQQLASALVSAEERERRKIADGLHDNVGQLLALAKLELGTLAEGSADAQACLLIARVEDLITQASTATRSLTFELSSPLLHNLGLASALQDLTERVAARSGVAIRFTSEGSAAEPSPERAMHAFTIVRELLRNLEAHAAATEASVSLRRDDGMLRIRVEDNGVGFDWNAVRDHIADRASFGLFNIRQQLELAGGSLIIDSAPGRGARVAVELPSMGAQRQ